jgi:predicted kinase
VLVSGPPGAGKSTLAQALSGHPGLPVLSMDLIEAGVASSIAGHLAAPGTSVTEMGGPAGERAFEATYELVEVCLRHDMSVIVEKAWQRGPAEPDLQRFLPVARAVQVHVTASEQVALRRALDRPRRPGFAAMEGLRDMLAAGTLTWEDFGPLELGIPLHVVSTDDGLPVDLADVEALIRAAAEQSRGLCAG